MSPPPVTPPARATSRPEPGTVAGRIGLSTPDLGPAEEAHLVRAFRSGWPGPSGPEIDAFEAELAIRAGTAHAAAVSSGTAALHLSLLALGIGPGDVVLVPTFTFAATANAVSYTGARPVFVDSDPATGNIDVDLVAEMLASPAMTDARVAAVMSVDINGTCADYDRLTPICDAAGVPLVEDAAQALGSTHRGRPAGSFGRLGTFSFSWNKIITTSSGGMVVSDEEALITRCRHLASQAREAVRHYEHRDVGYNYRLTNLAGALGRAQLGRLDSLVERRRALRERYAKLFASVDGTRILGDGDSGANCWLTSVVVDPDVAGWDATQLAAHLHERGIETRPMWKPMHRQPVYAHCRAVVTGVADRLFSTSVSLPSGSALTDDQIDRVMDAIDEFVSQR
ncbi:MULTISPECIES: DegT/DnrJ/EryC1/StrS family aminotransferase [unclassified Micromonospora]|uniref:DegT/DnrJ/EryC1/StrS family aminotransferase n=1 Tax=unclassified Micromonospora TaxID=2617518 RepID=UPI00363F0F9B